MKKIHLNPQDEQIMAFFRSLPLDHEGCILILEGKPLLKVMPVTEVPVDKAKLKAAILNRRDESRKLNEEWATVDREMWEKL